MDWQPKEPAHTAIRSDNAIKIVVALVIALAGLWIISGFLRALVWAGIIAIAIDPFYAKLERKLGGKHLSILAALVTLVIALILLVPIVIGISEATVDASAVISA